ncbi:MAG: NHLP leader peptide family RiPP precursor [Opitutales bacterium]|nr:NHLP leader peptide family RiPP precursor [Opitutales bacterium]MCH8539647.1 NHLP leader peptide family RiPP precursor [Opitutales bacterium]
MKHTNEDQKTLEKIYAKCHRDSAYKERFLADPKAVIKDEGFAVPDSLEIRAVEDTDPNLVTLYLPPEPSDKLSDKDLDKVSGGLSPVPTDSPDLQIKNPRPGSPHRPYPH